MSTETKTETKTKTKRKTAKTRAPEARPEPEATPGTKTVRDIVSIAEEMWKKIKATVKEDPSFAKLEDKKKLAHFRETLGYKEFMSEYPVVARYLVCMGQYSSKAFNRMLDRIRVVKHPPPNERPAGYVEDQWVRRQADYVRFLWEAYQRGHYNNAEAQYVWNDAYKKLKGEFDDFKNKYKEIEESTKEEKKTLQAANAKDLLNRLKTGEQKLSDEETQELVSLLKDKMYKRRYSNTMDELKRTHAETPATVQGQGTGAEEPTKPSGPVIKMIEHVDEDRIQEIPAEYRRDFSKQTVPSLETVAE